MGAYSPVPHLEAVLHQVEARILTPTLAGMADAGTPYRGFLYLGLMLTASGPQVLEYNCRLGDPEAQVLLPRLRSDFLQLLLACAGGDVASAPLDVDPCLAAVGVVIAAPGYPEAPRADLPVTGIDAARAGGALVYCAGVAGRTGALRSRGGRILTVVGTGPDLAAARAQAYAAVACIHVPGSFYRDDIALRALESSPWTSRVSAS
jgi:phosphoribosylamine--glycine ligase